MIEDYRKVVEQWKDEVRSEGETIGIAKGETIGIAKGKTLGEQQALHEALETIYISRFGPLPDPLKNRLQEVQAVDRLRVLIGLFASQPQEEVDTLLKG